MTTRFQRILFWILLGIFSTVIAEVTSTSTLFPFFSWYGFALIIPLYTLHIILLLTIIYRYGAPKLPTLYLGGMLFGLYEAYITKVLWHAPWAEPATIGGVGVLSLILLVLWWHPLMSFIIPALFGERLLTTSSETAQHLPSFLAKLFTKQKIVYTTLGLAALLGIFLGSRAGQAQLIFAAILANGIILLILVSIWRRFGKPAPLRELLPNKKEFTVLCILTGLFYLLTGIFIFPENFPSISGHITILLLYIIILFLFVRNLKKSKPTTTLPSKPALTIWQGLGAIALTLIAALLTTLAPPVGYVLGLITVIGCVIMFIWGIKNAIV